MRYVRVGMVRNSSLNVRFWRTAAAPIPASRRRPPTRPLHRQLRNGPPGIAAKKIFGGMSNPYAEVRPNVKQPKRAASTKEHLDDRDLHLRHLFQSRRL